MKRQHQKSAQMAAKRAADAAKAAGGASSNGANGDGSANGDDAKGDKDVKDENGAGTAGTPGSNNMPPPQGPGLQVPQNQQPNQPRQPWELVDEIMNMLKTAFPLLALTMEKMVDQISLRAKPSSDEDIYRFFAALLADALQVCTQAGNTVTRADDQQWGGRSGVPNDDGELNAMTKENLNKFSNNLSGDLKVSTGASHWCHTDMISPPSRKTS